MDALGSARLALIVLLTSACAGDAPALRAPGEAPAGPLVACVSFRVESVVALSLVRSPAIVGHDSRAVGRVVASSSPAAAAGDAVWVDFDGRVPPGRWAVGDPGTLLVDASGHVGRVLHGAAPVLCPPP